MKAETDRQQGINVDNGKFHIVNQAYRVQNCNTHFVATDHVSKAFLLSGNYDSCMTNRSTFGIWDIEMDWTQTFDTLELDVMEGRGSGTRDKRIPRAVAPERHIFSGQLTGVWNCGVRWQQSLQGNTTGVSRKSEFVSC